MQRHAFPHQSGRAQRGGIAMLFMLMLVPLMGFMTMALDLGRIYITKTELQGAADACALSAALHLTDNAPNAAAFTGATNSAQWIANKNKVNLQGEAVAQINVTVEFSPSLSGSPWAQGAAGPSAGSKFARCTVKRNNFRAWFMQLTKLSTFYSMSAQAIATIPTAAGSTNCGFPAGNCNQAPSLVF